MSNGRNYANGHSFSNGAGPAAVVPPGFLRLEGDAAIAVRTTFWELI